MDPINTDRAESMRRRAIVQKMRRVTAEHTALGRHISELHDGFRLLYGRTMSIAERYEEYSALVGEQLGMLTQARELRDHLHRLQAELDVLG